MCWLIRMMMYCAFTRCINILLWNLCEIPIIGSSSQSGYIVLSFGAIVVLMHRTRSGANLINTPCYVRNIRDIIGEKTLTILRVRRLKRIHPANLLESWKCPHWRDFLLHCHSLLIETCFDTWSIARLFTN